MRLFKCGVMSVIFIGMLGGCITQQPLVVTQVLDPKVEVLPPSPVPVPVSVSVPSIIGVPLETLSATTEVVFPQGSASLTPAGRAVLAGLLNVIGPSKIVVFIVTAHADSNLHPDKAKRLAMRRADAVKEYFVDRGIDKGQVEMHVKVAARPVYSSTNSASSVNSNRVSINVKATRSSADDPLTWMPNNVISVLYATNRKRTGSDSPFYFYGSQLAADVGAASLEYGVAVVRVPRERERGDIKRPPSTTLIIDRTASLLGIRNLPKPLLPNSATHFLYENTLQVLKLGDFKSTLRSAVKVSKGQAAILYVHGYNNDFTDAAFRTAQLVYDMAEANYDYVPLMFSWPSNPRLPYGFDYIAAGKRTEVSGEALAAFLREIAQSTDINEVHIVAHSMGSRVLATALEKLGTTKELSKQKNGKSEPVFKHIIFAAADISPVIFEKLIEPAIKSMHTVTSYVSSNDKILWMSQTGNFEPRIGYGFNHLPQCVDTVDVTAVGHGLAHSTWAESPRVIEDLRRLIRYSFAPVERGLRTRSNPGAAYWIFDTIPPVKGFPPKQVVSSILQRCNLVKP